MRKLLTIDEFRDSARQGERPDGTVRRLATDDAVLVDDAARTLRFVFSDGSVDRAGDAIDPEGWEIDDFLKNPVALWAHSSSDPPIGRASNVGPVRGKLIGDIEFMGADISAFADSIYRMVKAKFIRAVSVGFIPLEYAFVQDADRPWGIDFKRQELLEISICPIPCNPNALQEARSKGIDTAPLREWAEKVLDTGGSVIVPRAVLEETFRQAKTPRHVRQKYLARAEARAEPPEWAVGAAVDLPLHVADDWDGAAAAKRILDDAGFDGDTPDPEKAASGFLLRDAANPKLRSSYKLPFADIVDGTLKAVSGGVNTVAARLEQTFENGETLNDAHSVVAAYKSAFAASQLLAKLTPPPAPAEPVAPVAKAGRRHSAADRAVLDGIKKDVASIHERLDGLTAEPDGAADDPDNDGDKETPPEVQVIVLNEDPRAIRLREAQALKNSLKP